MPGLAGEVAIVSVRAIEQVRCPGETVGDCGEARICHLVGRIGHILEVATSGVEPAGVPRSVFEIRQRAHSNQGVLSLGARCRQNEIQRAREQCTDPDGTPVHLLIAEMVGINADAWMGAVRPLSRVGAGWKMECPHEPC